MYQRAAQELEAFIFALRRFCRLLRGPGPLTVLTLFIFVILILIIFPLFHRDFDLYNHMRLQTGKQVFSLDQKKKEKQKIILHLRLVRFLPLWFRYYITARHAS
eukprot:gb/GEZN01014708.1/.p1 GENE.gb/GEZN01014708.1/~~gb/GEZN01014708.1/.p1  ORF type:complete len:104 (-),score=5.95 gb/GEZN01014708.1/:121-432(-)